MEPATPEEAKKKEEIPMDAVVKTVWNSSDPDFTALVRQWKRVTEDPGKCRAAAGKHVVLMFGITGAGKSTSMNAMVNPGSLELDEDSGSIIVREGHHIEVDGRKMFTVSDDVVAETKTPGLVESPEGSNVVFVDAPGVDDANEDDEFPNQTIIHTVMVKAKTLALIVLFSGSDLAANRGENLLRLVTALIRHLTPDATLGDLSFIVPIFTNPGSIAGEKPMKSAIQKVVDLVEAKYKLYQKLAREKRGPNDAEHDLLGNYTRIVFPTDREIPAALKILRHILKHVRIMEPLDDVDEDDYSEAITVTAAALRDEMVDLAKSDKSVVPADAVAKDLPVLLHELLIKRHEGLTKNWFWHRAFTLQDSTVDLYHQFLAPWQGTKKEDTIQRLKDICHLLEESDLDWALRGPYERIAIVMYEQRVPGFEAGMEEVFARLFTAFLEKWQMTSEGDFAENYSDEVYKWAMKWLLDHADDFESKKEKTPIFASKRLAEEVFNGEAKLTARQSIEFLTSIDISKMEPEEASRWKSLFRTEFFYWYEGAWREAYEMRNKPLTLMTTLLPTTGMSLLRGAYLWLFPEKDKSLT